MNRRRWMLGLSLATALAVAACGAGASPATSGGGTGAAATPDPTPAATDAASGGGVTAATCAALLPPDEVRSILGVPPEPVHERTFPGTTECTWQYAQDGAAVQDFLQVILTSLGGDDSLGIATKDSEADSDSATPTAIDGIGDESYTWVGQGDYRRIYVRRGDRTLMVRGSSALPVLSTESTMIDFADRLFGRA